MKNKNKNKTKFVIAAGLTIVVLSGALFLTSNQNKGQDTRNKNGITSAKVSEKGDLLIPVADVTNQAMFYEYQTEDGTALEVMAVKASDGTVRTAFNTCQVCYSSGRGYYKQEGEDLVCQNCGNHFTADDVEVTKGGCNPVPIYSEYKTLDETTITISKDHLEEAKVIFENWKS